MSIIEENNLMDESINTFKNIDSIDQLKSTIEFLKEEIQERNLLINTLLLRNAKCGDRVDAVLLSKFQQSYVRNHSRRYILEYIIEYF